MVYAAKGNIYITASEHAALATITDIMGRTLHHQEISGHGQTIIPVNYKTGVYIVTVRNGKELITEKVFLK